MKLQKDEIIIKREIIVYSKQLNEYQNSIPLKIDLSTLKRLLNNYVNDPLSCGYCVTPEIYNILNEYIESEEKFDFNNYNYTIDIKVKRVIAVYDKQLGYYIKSLLLKIDLDVLRKLLQQYVKDPLSYSYEITPEMYSLLKEYIETTNAFDYNRFLYTMEGKARREIAIYDNKSDSYIKGIPLKVDLDILNQIFQQYDNDPLFYGCYEITPELSNVFKRIIKNEFDFDFTKFSYIVEARADYNIYEYWNDSTTSK